MKTLKQHKELYRLLEREQKRQSETINLIASENYASLAVREALATVFTNKYAEGKPKQRYYFGNENIDSVEEMAQELLLKLFNITSRVWSVNVQPYSGSTANFAVYAGLLKPGDTVLAMALDHGGHLTHGHKASFTSKVWKFVHYGVRKDGHVDYSLVSSLAKKHKPKLIVCGGSAYAPGIDFKKFGIIAKNTGAYLMADISHIAGLIAGGVHTSPFPYADIVTTTTHKTLRGPRAAVIFSRREISDAIDKAVFPGLQGGPHENTIFSLAVMAQEDLQPDFRRYARQVIKNAKAFLAEMRKLGFQTTTSDTDTHLFLVDLSKQGISEKEAGQLLEAAGIVVNKNAIPNDSRKPWDPSGIRIGTPAVTTRGMKEKEMRLIAHMMKRMLINRESVMVVRKEVRKLTKKFLSPNP